MTASYVDYIYQHRPELRIQKCFVSELGFTAITGFPKEGTASLQDRNLRNTRYQKGVANQKTKLIWHFNLDEMIALQNSILSDKSLIDDF